MNKGVADSQESHRPQQASCESQVLFMADRSHKELQPLVATAALARQLFPRRGIDGVAATGAQLEVLVAVAAHPGLSTEQLAEHLAIHPTGVGRAFNALEAARLITTQRRDTRRAALTTKGQRAVATFTQHAADAPSIPR